MKKILEAIKNFFSASHEREQKGIQATKHGMFNNFVYAVKLTWQLNNQFIIAMIVMGVLSALYMLIGIYIPKIVLALVENKVTTDIMIKVLVAVGIIILVVKLINTKAQYVGEYAWDKVYKGLVSKYLRKSFTTDFKNMENPDFLDLIERSKHAMYNYQGISGYCRRGSNILSNIVLVVIAGAAIAVINPLIILVLVVISYFIYKILDSTMEWTKVNFRDAMSSNFRKNYYFSSTARDFKYAKDIRLFKMQDFIEQTWKDINTVYYAACKKNHRKWVMCEAKMSFLRLFQNLLLYVVLIYMVLNKGMSISDFVLYIGLVASFSTAMTDMFCNMVWMNMNRMELDDFRTFMDWNEDKPDIEKGQGVSKNIGLKQFEFKFENVSFKYPGHEKYVLKNINLTIEAGSKLAVVGINGAGKTTLTKLLMRLYEPTEGRILLNGVDVKKYDRDTYFKIFAPVFQNIEIFAFPVWQNISMKPENETDKNRTMEALERSGLDEKINKYENKIDTMLLRIFDPNGVDLSGGERQRLAMARALYQNREVLVLDEPTAALDALAEDRMYQEFNQMVKGKTAIFISHRLSSTRFCDKIVMFEDGRIIEEGTHEQLINANGKYRNMFQVQAQYYKDKEGEVC
ncbi:ABC transporter ATP-binding protein [Eubacterium ventriosum]|uniref:ABC transporter ATP-binding protein n=1 Tax=Eubacterium ventriosum TaxID=39496 RepID=UPI003999CB7E